MTDREKAALLSDVPDPGKLEEHGISIDAPTPTQIVMPNPWGGNGTSPAHVAPDASGPSPSPVAGSDD